MRRFAVYLADLRLGELVSFPDGTLFTFDDSAGTNEQLPVLSQSFLDERGRTLNTPVVEGLVPYFANLLPEPGPLRRYLASMHRIAEDDDLALLAALGENLPGAVRVVALEEDGSPIPLTTAEQSGQWRFSLAGVQMKFSASRDGGQWSVATITHAGDWILKFASSDAPGVVENEFGMMRLARDCGLNVPETALVDVSRLNDLEERFRERGAQAFAIRRFDRANGTRVHQEDFCQITVRPPFDKYAESTQPFGLENVLRIVNELCGLDDAREFVRRFAFNVAVGNGDAHLKNFAVIYPNGRDAALAPLYDVVCTLRYEPRDTLALPVAGVRSFNLIDRDIVKSFARSAGVSTRIVLHEFAEMADRVAAAWPEIADGITDERLRMIVDHRVATALSKTLHNGGKR